MVLSFVSIPAIAEDHPYSEGPVVNVAAIRTECGKFDEYMNYLATTWTQTQEAAKKAGHIVSYEVLTVANKSAVDRGKIRRVLGSSTIATPATPLHEGHR